MNGRVRSRLRMIGTGIGLVSTFVLLPASPAWAHSVVGPSGSSNYRSALVDIRPKVLGISAAVLDDGQHIAVTNATAVPLVILGYSGEPYLMVDSLGVWQNLRSPSLYLNLSSAPGLVYMPPGTNALAPPVWKKTCRCDVAVWHDHRVHWSSPGPPRQVSASPGRYHLIQDWNIIGRLGEQTLTVSGRLTWVPGPSPAPWFGVAAAIAAVSLLVGFARRWRIPLASLLLVLVAADMARTAGVVFGRSGSLATQLHVLPYDGVISVLFWLASLAVAGLALLRRPVAAYGAATAAIIIVLTGAVSTLGALSHSQVLSAYPVDVQRFLIAVNLGVGSGLFAGSFILIDRLDKLSLVRERARS